MQDRQVLGKRNGCMKMAFTMSYKYTSMTSLWISNQGRFKGHRWHGNNNFISRKYLFNKI